MLFGGVIVVSIFLLSLVVSFSLHQYRHTLIYSTIFSLSFSFLTLVWILFGVKIYNKDDSAILFSNPIFMYCSVYYIFLGISTLPPLVDPSFLEKTFNITGVFYLGMLLALAGILFVLFGSKLAGFTAIGREKISLIRRSLLAFSEAKKNRLLLCTFVLFVTMWSLRYYQILTGTYSKYSNIDPEYISGWMSIAVFLPGTLQYFAIPLAVFLRCGSESKFVRIFSYVVIAMEFFNAFSISKRTLILTLFVQLIAAYTLLNKVRTRRVFLIIGAGMLFFLLVVQPLVYTYRYVTGEIVGGTDDFYSVFWSDIWEKTAESVASGKDDELEIEWGERDLKYRLVSQRYLSVLAREILLKGKAPPYGEFTLKNAGSVVPSLVWENKHKYTLTRVKQETPDYYRIPRIDYQQTLPSHFLSDGGIPGLAIGMIVFGMYLAIVAKWFFVKADKYPVRALMFLYLVPPLFFNANGDFRIYFLDPWRSGLPIYALIYIMLNAKIGYQKRNNSLPPGCITSNRAS